MAWCLSVMCWTVRGFDTFRCRLGTRAPKPRLADSANALWPQGARLRDSAFGQVSALRACPTFRRPQQRWDLTTQVQVLFCCSCCVLFLALQGWCFLACPRRLQLPLSAFLALNQPCYASQLTIPEAGAASASNSQEPANVQALIGFVHFSSWYPTLEKVHQATGLGASVTNETQAARALATTKAAGTTAFAEARALREIVLPGPVQGLRSGRE